MSIRPLSDIPGSASRSGAQTLVALEQRDHDLEQMQLAVIRREHELERLRQTITSLEGQLARAQLASRRTEESVTWQAIQTLRGRVYGAIGGERSLLARLLGASLQAAGRSLVARRAPEQLPAYPEAALGIDDSIGAVIELPEYPDPHVSLIIPVHSRADLTEACLYSIADHTTHASYEVILVDDTADQNTKRLLDRVKGAKVLRNERNLGYLRSMNRGAAAARGDWLVLSNNDIEVTRNWLNAMLRCAGSAPDIGVVTPKFIYPDGSLNEAGGIVWRDGTAMNYGRGDDPHHFQYEYRRETDYGSGAALMVRTTLWKKVGGFDERYVPIYYEDADICFQSREHGLRVMYEPEALVVHVEGATSGTDPTSGAKRHQEINRQSFVEKWSSRLPEQWASAPVGARVAADRFRGPRVLVIDHRMPMPDRDAGSLRMLNIMRSLIGLGARVTFMPENLADAKPYTRMLQRMGIEVLYGELDVQVELAILGPELSAAILCRPHAASHWLDTVREFSPAATVVYDTVDLHWLREARRHASADLTHTLVTGNDNPSLKLLPPRAKALRELELAMIRASDMTLVVTDSERVQVERDVPGSRVMVVPTIHDVEECVTPPQDRSGILFVGGFEHIPNVDAAIRLVKEVMPAVRDKLGDVQVTIVGSNAPPEVKALASPSVDVAGWVKDLRPLLEQARMLAAPLWYGAGLKGKVTQCLAVGLPVVTTSIGAEGLVSPPSDEDGTRDGEACLLIADSTSEMAQRMIALYTDDELWRRLSEAGQRLIAERCSTDVVSRRLAEMLGPTWSPSPFNDPEHLLY
ncbi:MAG: glycosyltransferase [Solirubrobacteraceae bacterium]